MQRSFLLACLAVISVLAVACGDTGDADPIDTPSAATSTETATPSNTRTPAPTAPASPATAAATATAQPVTGCQLPAADLGTSVTHSLTSGTATREYRLYLPGDPDEAADGPVVLNFHGLGSNMLEQEAYSGLVPVAEREGFVLVTPNGSGTPRSWNAIDGLPLGTNDIQFVRDILSELEDTFCIDTTAVYSTGMSNGAFMSSRLACLMGDRITAIAPVAGVYFPAVDCGERVAVLAFHGTDDAVVPYAGGNIFNAIPYQGAERGVYGWAQFNGCAPNPAKDDAIADDVHVITYDSCGGGADASLVVVEGGGHTWPGAPDIHRLGHTTHNISAAEMIWEFFAAHPALD